MLFEKQIVAAYQKTLFVRNDNADGIFYFSADDFPGLQSHPYIFPGKQGHLLQGWFYHYDNPDPRRVVVFEHGLGNGHRAYMKEIEVLAKAGFLVFAYDHTGCMESGGDSVNGFSQSLCDLDDCITALKGLPELRERTISVMGHSWGGFSTMNITALHPEITHVVSMSGFVSVEVMLGQLFTGIMAPFQAPLLDLERRTNPDFVHYDARESLKDTQAKVLLVYSSNDSVVSKAVHYDALQKALAGKPNIRFLLVHGKNHSPNYTIDAAAYKDKFFNEMEKARKNKQLQTKAQQKQFMSRYDWDRMTAQDQRVWTIILDWLKG